MKHKDEAMLLENTALEISKEQRRLNREARREKQRAKNLILSAKMHEDRLSWDSSPEMKIIPLKADHKESIINIGCSGWFYWHWRNVFYPANLPTNNWFAHYITHFKTVELNAPFYSWPTTATVRNWIKQTNEADFIYTVKVSELITHIKRFVGTKTLIHDFGHIADILGSRMGCFLFQLPPSFQYSSARLKRIVSQLDPRRRNVVEFRHASWWNPRVYDCFREAGIIFCSCSAPKLPDELIKTADDIYIRFHGVKQWYRHDYTSNELEMWANRIVSSQAKTVWAYFNNDREAFAIQNAHFLFKKLKSL